MLIFFLFSAVFNVKKEKIISNTNIAYIIFHVFMLQGGWGWLVVGAAFLVQVLTTGLQLAFGVMASQIARYFRKENAVAIHMDAGESLSRFLSIF